MGDTGFYARAADAIRSTLVLVSEAADAVQRAEFFARLANSNDEADAAAVEAHLTAVWARGLSSAGSTGDSRLWRGRPPNRCGDRLGLCLR